MTCKLRYLTRLSTILTAIIACLGVLVIEHSQHVPAAHARVLTGHVLTAGKQR